MIRKLGPEGMAAARLYGPGAAEIIAKEGPETLGVLRKTGKGGWNFFTNSVLPHKKKLIAAGVFAVFLANPDRFVDTAGKATQYAVEQFAKAGIRLAGAVGGGAAQGATNAFMHFLSDRGLSPFLARSVGMLCAGAVAVFALCVALGIPLRRLGRAISPLSWFKLKRKTAATLD